MGIGRVGKGREYRERKKEGQREREEEGRRRQRLPLQKKEGREKGD